MKRAAAICSTVCLIASGLGGIISTRAAARDDIGIKALEPSRIDSMLVCMIHTAGLPDRQSRETLRSGLPSAVVLAFSLFDLSGKEIGGTRAEVRIEPDLWEQVLVMRTPLSDHRVGSIDEITSLMTELGPIPVAPLDRLPSTSMRLTVRMAVHPLAQTEVERVRAIFGGEQRDERTNRREVSVGFGSLLRYFLGSQPDEDWIAEANSEPFRADALEEVQ